MWISKTSKILLPIWTAIILYLTLVPGNMLVKTPLFSYDKLGHLLVFLVWTVLYWIVLDDSGKYSEKSVNIRAFFVSSAFGIIIEVLQYSLPISRSAEFYDIVADIAGTLIGLAVIVPILRYFSKKFSLT